VQEISSRIGQGIKKSNQLKAGLTDLVEVGPKDSDDILVLISFSGNASMNNIVDFKKWGAEWHDIGRGIAMVHGMAPDEVRVVGAKNGSIVIELAVAYGFARTISGIILETLKVTERILDIKRKAEEIRGMKLGNDKIAKELEQEAESEKEKEVERVASEVAKRLEKKSGQDGDQIKALEVSVKKLVGFIEKGGEVDCVVPEEKKAEGEETEDGKEQARQLSEIRESISQIRLIEAKIKRIEYRGPNK
jgi:hypothetical protein